MKFIRRTFWYASSFVRRYRFIILTSLFLSISFFLISKYVFHRIPKPKQNIYIGVVGVYTAQNLPDVVNKILASGLTSSDASQKIIPNLASDWEIEPGGKSYIFHLRKGIYWPDNSPIKSKEIKLSIPGVEISYPDDQSIRFSIPEVFAPFPSILVHPIFNSRGQSPSGFTAVVTQGSSGNLKNISLDSPNKTINIKIFNSNSQAITAFKLGNIDYLVDLNSKPNIDSSPSIMLNEEVNYQQITTLFFNTQDPNLADKSIRQAVAYLIKDKGFGKPRAISSVSPFSWAYNPLVKTYDYSVERGKQLINDNLPAEKRNFSLELATLPEHLDTADEIKNELSEQGIELSVRVVNSVPDNYQLFLGNFNLSIDPDQYPNWHSTQAGNITHIKEPKIDKLLEDGRTTLDQKQRKQIYLDFQKTLMEELPALFLYYPYKYQLSRGPLTF